MATISFLADWSERVEGEIQRGEPLIIEYAHERARCRHEDREGYGNWGVEVYVHFAGGGIIFPDGAKFKGTVIGQGAGPSGVSLDSLGALDHPAKGIWSAPFEVTVPSRATEVEIWFRNYTYGESPQTCWDSNYGQNYRFEVTDTDLTNPSTISFLADWSERVEGRIQRGQPLVIEYAHERARCRHPGRGYSDAAWGVEVHIRFFPGGEKCEGTVIGPWHGRGSYNEAPGPRPGSVSLASLGAPFSKGIYSAPYEVTVPLDATAVDMCFFNWTGYEGTSSSWDSNYGQNYRFEITDAD
jgi:hypothetical protein